MSMRHTLLHHNINTTKVIIVGDLVMAAGPYLLLFNLRMCVIPWNVVVVAAAAAADVYYPAYDTLPAVVVVVMSFSRRSSLTSYYPMDTLLMEAQSMLTMMWSMLNVIECVLCVKV